MILPESCEVLLLFDCVWASLWNRSQFLFGVEHEQTFNMTENVYERINHNNNVLKDELGMVLYILFQLEIINNFLIDKLIESKLHLEIYWIRTWILYFTYRTWNVILVQMKQVKQMLFNSARKCQFVVVDEVADI